MRMLNIIPGVIVIVMLTSCTAVEQVTAFVNSLAENMAPAKNMSPSMSEPVYADELIANEDSPFSLQLYVADDDLQYGDKLTFSSLRLPDWLYLTLDGILEGTEMRTLALMR